MIDTAGLEESAPETLSGRMRAQTEAAIAAADAVLFLIDARAGLTPDRSRLRRAGAQVRHAAAILIANKSEGRAAEGGRDEAYSLGLGEPVAISAEHGEGLSDLYDALRAALPEADRTRQARRRRRTAEAEGPRPIRVAMSGGPMPASRR